MPSGHEFDKKIHVHKRRIKYEKAPQKGQFAGCRHTVAVFVVDRDDDNGKREPGQAPIQRVFCWNEYRPTAPSTKLSAKSTSAPAITVLVHGFGGSAADWSNESGIKKDAKKRFVYDDESLIENLRRAVPGSSVYLVTKWRDFEYKVHGTEDSPETCPNGLWDYHYYGEVCFEGEFDAATFELVKLTPKAEKQNGEPYDEQHITHLTEVPPHSIIVFEASENSKKDSHNAVYEELNYAVDKVLYDYQMLTGEVPRINLIGHSRGGNVIARFVAEHPFNVADVFTIGTPHDDGGVVLGASNLISSLINLYTLYLLQDKLPEEVFDGTTSGVRNILSDMVRDKLIEGWNEAMLANDSINAHAIAGYNSWMTKANDMLSFIPTIYDIEIAIAREVLDCLAGGWIVLAIVSIGI